MSKITFSLLVLLLIPCKSAIIPHTSESRNEDMTSISIVNGGRASDGNNNDSTQSESDISQAEDEISSGEIFLPVSDDRTLLGTEFNHENEPEDITLSIKYQKDSCGTEISLCIPDDSNPSSEKLPSLSPDFVQASELHHQGVAHITSEDVIISNCTDAANFSSSFNCVSNYSKSVNDSDVLPMLDFNSTGIIDHLKEKGLDSNASSGKFSNITIPDLVQAVEFHHQGVEHITSEDFNILNCTDSNGANFSSSLNCKLNYSNYLNDSDVLPMFESNSTDINDHLKEQGINDSISDLYEISINESISLNNFASGGSLNANASITIFSTVNESMFSPDIENDYFSAIRSELAFVNSTDFSNESVATFANASKLFGVNLFNDSAANVSVVISSNLTNITGAVGLSELSELSGENAGIIKNDYFTPISSELSFVNSTDFSNESVISAFSNTSKLSGINAMNDILNKSVSAANVSVVAISNLTNITMAISNLTNITEAISNLTNITEAISNLTNITGTISNLMNITEAVSNLTNITGANSNLTNITGTISNLTNITGVIINLTNITGAISNLTNITGIISNLTNITGAINLAEISELSGANTSLSRGNSSSDDPLRECPPPGMCLLWFLGSDSCASDMHCPNSKKCCKVRCFKTCLDV